MCNVLWHDECFEAGMRDNVLRASEIALLHLTKHLCFDLGGQ